jgi:HEAT repeat protein
VTDTLRDLDGVTAEQREQILHFLELQRSLDFDLLEYLKSDPRAALADLASDDMARVQAAVLTLWGLKEKAPDLLLSFLGETDHGRARAIAMYLLSRLAPDYQGRLLARLMDGATEEEAPRLVRAWVESGATWGGKAATVLLSHPSSAVRRAVGRILATAPLPPGERLSMLMAGAATDDPGQASDAIRAIGAVGGDEAVIQLATFLKKGMSWGKGGSDTDRVHCEVCLALGNTAAASAVPHLLGILGSGLAGKLFGRASSAVRASAVWALARLGGDKALQAVEKSASDSDLAVKGVATLIRDNPPAAIRDEAFDPDAFYALFASPAP